MDTDNLKLIDFQTDEYNYNKVILYFGDTECEKYY